VIKSLNGSFKHDFFFCNILLSSIVRKVFFLSPPARALPEWQWYTDFIFQFLRTSSPPLLASTGANGRWMPSNGLFFTLGQQHRHLAQKPACLPGVSGRPQQQPSVMALLLPAILLHSVDGHSGILFAETHLLFVPFSFPFYLRLISGTFYNENISQM
jgi:hypothetical protein